MKRHITLLVENFNEEGIAELINYCKYHKLDFKYRYGKVDAFKDYLGDGIAPLYYFTIFGNTKDYEEMNNYFEGKIILTDYAEICNVADEGDEFEERFKNLINILRESQHKSIKANDELTKFLMPIKNIKLLEEIKHYSCYMNDFQKEILETRIYITKGEREVVDEQFLDDMLSLHNDVKLLRECTGMNRKEFANYFKIPYRTVEDWENKKSTCSNYLYRLMVKELNRNGLIKIKNSEILAFDDESILPSYEIIDKSNRTIANALLEVKKVTEESKEKRTEAIKELEDLENQLKNISK